MNRLRALVDELADMAADLFLEGALSEAAAGVQPEEKEPNDER